MPQPAADIDGVYRSQKARLASIVVAGANALLARGLKDRDQTIPAIVSTVTAGQARTVALVDAYMSIKANRPPIGLDASLYTTAAIRHKPADVIYARPWGALGGQLAEGAKYDAAAGSAQASLERLVRTDLQLAQTHSARDWMTRDPSVTAYERVITSGKPCELCVQASQGIYHTDALMPIHEHCECAVTPLFGQQSPTTVRADVRVADDDEIGPRLLAPGWHA